MYQNALFLLIYLVDSKKITTFIAFIILRFMRKTERTYNSNLRGEHFVAAVQQRLRSDKHHTPFRLICSQVASQPAPQFYVSPQVAMSKYWEYKRTGIVRAAHETTRQMYLEIIRRVDERLSQSPCRMYLYRVIQDVIEEPAPSFYIESNEIAAAVYYYRFISAKRKKNRKAK